YLMRGRIYFHNKGDHGRALVDYDQALKLNPRYAAVFYFRSFVHRERNNPDGAIADLSEAIKLNSDEASLYTERAFAYMAKNEVELALADAEQAIKLDPEDTTALALREILNGPTSSSPRGVGDGYAYFLFRYFDVLRGVRK